MNKLIIVVAVALIKNKKVLFQERPSEKSMPFLWELPGGKIQIGETPETALIREVNEELGISINFVDLRSHHTSAAGALEDNHSTFQHINE